VSLLDNLDLENPGVGVIEFGWKRLKQGSYWYWYWYWSWHTSKIR